MKFLRRKDGHTIVVDFSRGSINMAAAESAGEAVRFRGITQVPMPQPDESGYDPDEVVRRIAAEVKRRGWQGMPSACLLSRSATSTQTFQFPPMPDEDLRSAIALKLDETLHFDLEEAYFDFRRVRESTVEGREQVLTLVAVARKDAIERAVDVLRRAGLRPVAVGAASESLANLTYYASPCDAEDATVHVDIGSESTILNLFEGRLLRFSREIDVGSESFVQALMRPIITPGGAVQLTHVQASDVLSVAGCPQEDEEEELPFGVRSSDVLPLVEPVAQRLSAEIRQSSSYLAGILGRPKIDYVVLSGTGAQMRRLDTQLEESLDVPVVPIDPVARAIAHWRLAIVGEQRSSPAGFSAILGYSLGAHRPINLLPRERRTLGRKLELPTVKQVVVPSSLAVGAALSIAAVPLQRDFNETYDRMVETTGHLDRRILEESEAVARREAVHASVEDVRGHRGPLVSWTGLLKEISLACPAEGRVDEVSSTKRLGAVHVTVKGEMRDGDVPFEARVTRMSLDLGESPFVRTSKTLDVERDRRGGSGTFELALELEDVGRPGEDAR